MQLLLLLLLPVLLLLFLLLLLLVAATTPICKCKCGHCRNEFLVPKPIGQSAASEKLILAKLPIFRFAKLLQLQLTIVIRNIFGFYSLITEFLIAYCVAYLIKIL